MPECHLRGREIASWYARVPHTGTCPSLETLHAGYMVRPKTSAGRGCLGGVQEAVKRRISGLYRFGATLYCLMGMSCRG